MTVAELRERLSNQPANAKISALVGGELDHWNKVQLTIPCDGGTKVIADVTDGRL